MDGYTTLLLDRRAGSRLIVLNHTPHHASAQAAAPERRRPGPNPLTGDGPFSIDYGRPRGPEVSGPVLEV